MKTNNSRNHAEGPFFKSFQAKFGTYKKCDLNNNV